MQVLNDSGLYFYNAAATFSSGRTAVSTQLRSEYSTIEGANQVIHAVQPGWYPDPEGPGQRYWDGQAWGPRAPAVGLRTAVSPAATFPPQEKSSGVAVLLTVLWPGAGHLYLGLTQKAIPYFVANAIGVVFALSIYLFPIAILIWLVTLA